MRRAAPSRSFDPPRAGRLECAMWVAYYRHEWVALLRSAVFLIRHVFGLSWPSTIRASWFVLRATQLWAPVPDNDPVAARLAMERFFRLVTDRYDESFDAAEAARLEVEWWRVHREDQHSNGDSDQRALVDALVALYAYAFGLPDAAVRGAAEQRALAMRYSDQWVRDGCDLQSPLIARQRSALVGSYAGLLATVRRRGGRVDQQRPRRLITTQ
ncbi:MAG: hypothetical protein ACLP50_26965 [Solirubrobacteraceae bacterium]